MKLMLHLVLLIFFGVSVNAQPNNQMKKPLLSAAQMHHDLQVLQDAFTSMHPGIYRFQSQEEFQEMFKQLKQRCSVPMSPKQFYLL